MLSSSCVFQFLTILNQESDAPFILFVNPKTTHSRALLPGYKMFWYAQLSLKSVVVAVVPVPEHSVLYILYSLYLRDSSKYDVFQVVVFVGVCVLVHGGFMCTS